MATTIRLVKRLKLTEIYSEEHLARIKSGCSPEEFSEFWSGIVKSPWRFCPVLSDSRGRYSLNSVKLPGAKSTDGVEVTIERKQGTFHLDYRENGKRQWDSVVKVLNEAGRTEITLENLSARDVTDAVNIVERRLSRSAGVPATLPKDEGAHSPVEARPREQSSSPKRVVREAIDTWVLDRTSTPGRLSGEAKLTANTLTSYRTALHNFASFLSDVRHCDYLEDITRDDLKMYYEYMSTMPNRKSPTGLGLSNSSRNIKLTVIGTFLRGVGMHEVIESFIGSKRVSSVKRERNEETDVNDYTDEQISAMFKVMNIEERELFQFFLSTGMRAGEVAVAEWHQLKPDRGEIQVRIKTVRMGDGEVLKFYPKHKKERDIPVPQGLFDMLEARRLRVPASNLIFPTDAALPTGVFARWNKSVGHRAHLHCGHCMGCETRRKTLKGGCELFKLHRWRHTFATRHLQGNADGTGRFDVKTVSTWLGHRNTQTTERYLHAARGQEVALKLNVGPLSRTFAA